MIVPHITIDPTMDVAQTHDEWMHAQIEQALVEADDPNTVWLGNEEVKARSAARRAQLRKRAAELALEAAA